MAHYNYKVTLYGGDTFIMSGDFAEASTPIRVNFHDGIKGEWQSTPYQTADANGVPIRGAQLIVDHYNMRKVRTVSRPRLWRLVYNPEYRRADGNEAEPDCGDWGGPINPRR